MASVFYTTFSSIFLLCKILGLINMSYTLNSTGLLISYTYSTYNSILELTRMIVLMMFTYNVHKNGFYYVRHILLLKFWVVIIAARLSEKWIIKLINGIIEYDQKLLSISTFLLIHQRCPRKKYWNILFTSFLLYFILFKIYNAYLWPPKTIEITVIMSYIFYSPFITDFAVIIAIYYHLEHLANRFQTLNDLLKYLPDGLIAVPDKWTHIEIALQVEKIRLLHAELSELLQIFNCGYGLLIVTFFLFCFIQALICIIFIVCFKITIAEVSFIENVLRFLRPHIMNGQNVTFMIIIIVAASRTNYKREKIISYLRLIQISRLPLDIKRQVIIFMNQVSLIHSDEVINAFGFFNIDLNLTISILVLLITGLATLVEMKEHPIIRHFVNDTTAYLNSVILNT